MSVSTPGNSSVVVAVERHETVSPQGNSSVQVGAPDRERDAEGEMVVVAEPYGHKRLMVVVVHTSAVVAVERHWRGAGFLLL